MRGAGQQRPLRAHQGLDAVGRAIEGRGQGRHLVAALHVHAGGEVARAQPLHARAQTLQPARQAAGHGIGPHGDGHRQQGQDGEDAGAREAPVALARHQPAPVRQVQEPDRSAPRRHPSALRAAAGIGQPVSAPGDGLPLGAPQREVEVQGRGQRAQRLVLRRGIAVGGEAVGDARGRVLERFLLARGEPAVVPGDARQDREHHEDGQDGQVDLQVQPPHQSSSWARAKT